MLCSIEGFSGQVLQARDGDAGRVREFLFDYREWTVRYCVLELPGGGQGREVLVSPSSFSPTGEAGGLAVGLTREQVLNSPKVELSRPLSHRDESRIREYYGLPPFWSVRSASVGPGGVTMVEEKEIPGSHLQATERIRGFTVEGTDGTIGSLAGFVIDDQSWQILYADIDTADFLPVDRTLLFIEWIKAIDWEQGTVSVPLRREVVADSPAYDPQKTITVEYADALYNYYQLRGYRYQP